MNRRLVRTSCGWGWEDTCRASWKGGAHPELPRLEGWESGFRASSAAPGQEACEVEFSSLVLIPYSVTTGDDTCVRSLSEHQRLHQPWDWEVWQESKAGPAGMFIWRHWALVAPSPPLISWTVVSIGQ